MKVRPRGLYWAGYLYGILGEIGPLSNRPSIEATLFVPEYEPVPLQPNC